jgi:hypothetical protein
MTIRRALYAIALAAVCVSASALADIPPPGGYEEQCTTAKRCTADEEGASCGADFREPDRCKKLHAADGYAYRCRTRGASVWREVYCRKREAKK